MAKRQQTTTNDLARLRDTADRQERLDLGLDLFTKSRDLEIVRAALSILAEEHDPELRPMLHQKYEWCEASASKRDSSGFIRADIVRALHPIAQTEDDALLRRALMTYQMQGLYELCAELRAPSGGAAGDERPRSRHGGAVRRPVPRRSADVLFR